GAKTGAAGAVIAVDQRVCSMRDRVRADAGLTVASGVQERGPLRRADPFVKVARIPGGPEPVEIERKHAGRMGAIDERLDATRHAEEAVEVPREDLDRLPFEPVPVVPPRRENGARAGSERAVIQEGDRGIEGPQAGELGGHRQIMTGTLEPWEPWTRWIHSS